MHAGMSRPFWPMMVSQRNEVLLDALVRVRR
jgi:hypothetical protein